MQIASRYCGPATSANGGYACGVVASILDGGAELRDGDRVIATAAPTTVALAPPAPASFAEAERASTLYPWRDGGRHPYPRCFVCGPEFGDGVLLGRLAAHVVERPRVVERCVAQGSALFSDDGALSAVARATWIVLKS